jgi:tRNA threonylcarbamoyladenosine biosynthesis protein TsaB
MLPMLDATLKELGWQPGDIQHIYVSAGPGSFTGLRIAFSFAKTLAFSLGCKLVLVPTVEVLAANAPLDAMNIAVVLDAKRSQIYTAAFSRATPGQPLRQIYPTKVVPPADMLAAAPRPLCVLGEGIDYHREAMAFGPDVIELPREIWPPRADAVARIGLALARAGQFTAPDDAIPIYLRRPEAEEVWEKRHKG